MVKKNLQNKEKQEGLIKELSNLVGLILKKRVAEPGIENIKTEENTFFEKQKEKLEKTVACFSAAETETNFNILFDESFKNSFFELLKEMLTAFEMRNQKIEREINIILGEIIFQIEKSNRSLPADRIKDLVLSEFISGSKNKKNTENNLKEQFEEVDKIFTCQNDFFSVLTSLVFSSSFSKEEIKKLFLSKKKELEWLIGKVLLNKKFFLAKELEDKISLTKDKLMSLFEELFSEEKKAKQENSPVPLGPNIIQSKDKKCIGRVEKIVTKFILSFFEESSMKVLFRLFETEKKKMFILVKKQKQKKKKELNIILKTVCLKK